jgi:hypothetical protein
LFALRARVITVLEASFEDLLTMLWSTPAFPDKEN